MQPTADTLQRGNTLNGSEKGMFAFPKEFLDQGQPDIQPEAGPAAQEMGPVEVKSTIAEQPDSDRYLDIARSHARETDSYEHRPVAATPEVSDGEQNRNQVFYAGMAVLQVRRRAIEDAANSEMVRG